jgi:hypothetical protein
LNSNVYRARVALIILFPFADCQLWDTFRGGKIKHSDLTCLKWPNVPDAAIL